MDIHTGHGFSGLELDSFNRIRTVFYWFGLGLFSKDKDFNSGKDIGFSFSKD
jgi:hypothetical protein